MRTDAGRWSTERCLLTSAGAVAVLVAVLAGLLLTQLHVRTTQDAYRQLSKMALVLSRSVEGNLQSVERLEDGFVEMVRTLDIQTPAEFNRLMAAKQVHQDLLMAGRSLPFVAASFLIDAAGDTIASTRSFPAPASPYAERLSFAALRDDPATGSVLEAPAADPRTGAWTMDLLRRLRAPDGQFLGLIGAAMDLDSFNVMLDRVDLGTGSSIAIWRKDMRMVAGSPSAHGVIGQTVASGSPMAFDAAPGGRECCVLRSSASMGDGVDRLIAMRALDGYPLAVVVTRSAGETFRVWRRQVWHAGVGMLLAWLMLAAATVLALRHVRTRRWLDMLAADRRVQEAQNRSHDLTPARASFDALTGLGSRTLLRERLEAAVQERDSGSRCALLCIDIDHFKTINDTLGRLAGDTLLQLVAERLRRLAGPGDTLVRLGSDEFALLHVGLMQAHEAEVAARDMLSALTAPFDLDGDRLRLTISIGVAVSADDTADAETMPRNADLALNRAKADGRSCFRLFAPEMTFRATLRRRLQYDLARALESEFELYYQPQINLETGVVTGFEALIRWHDPQLGMVTPDSFIPIAEETGVIVQLGSWILDQACRTAQTWPGEERIAVNLSPVQFEHPLLVETVAAALARSGLAPWRLELEVTEMVLLRDPEATLATLHRLKALGLTVALDDFGTGYSSLSYLHRFPFDKVKIDRSFINNIGRSTVSLAIVRAVVELCAVLDIKTNAEGVETEAQREVVVALGCTESQGYLFGKARPADEAAAIVERLRKASLQDRVLPA